MASSDTSEKGLETLIVAAMTGIAGQQAVGDAGVRENWRYGGTGYLIGDAKDYDRDHAIDFASC